MTKNPDARALLAADTDRTLEYVFESARLPEIRGASTILDELNRKAAPALIKQIDDSAECIYVGGGSLLYEVDAAQAPGIQRELESLYPQKTGVATITCVYRELPDSPDKGIPQTQVDTTAKASLSAYQRQRLERADKNLGCFGAWVRLLGHDLRRRKQEKSRAPFIESMPHAKRCRSCRIRPAEAMKVDYEGERALCRECSMKKNHNERSPWRDKFEENLRKWYPDQVADYLAEAEDNTVWIPRDINVIASACRPRNPNKRNYVAFIYADGDGVGAFVEQQRTRENYKKVSQTLGDATWHAVTFALAKNLPVQVLDNPWEKEEETAEERQRPTQPFEIITVGGDDVMLIVPAHAALAVARDMSAEFSRFLQKEKDIDDLTLSVGMVIAPAHMPVRLMRDFALEVLKKGAKRRSRGIDTAAVDFQVFTSTAITGINVMTVRKHPPYNLAQPDDPQGKPLHLYHRPYALPELERLLDALAALNSVDFPTSQLYPLAATLERGRHRSTLFYLYQRSRLKAEHRKALAQIEAIVPARPLQDPLPWYRPPSADARYAFSTPLRDVAELYDFVPESVKEVSS